MKTLGDNPPTVPGDDHPAQDAQGQDLGREGERREIPEGLASCFDPDQLDLLEHC